MPNELGLLSGSQTHTEIGIINPDDPLNLIGNGELPKTSSGTIDNSTTIGTIPDEINLSELEEEDPLLFLFKGGDSDHLSQTLGELTNSETLVTDPLTGSNSEPTTTITSDNSLEKSTKLVFCTFDK